MSCLVFLFISLCFVSSYFCVVGVVALPLLIKTL